MKLYSIEIATAKIIREQSKIRSVDQGRPQLGFIQFKKLEPKNGCADLVQINAVDGKILSSIVVDAPGLTDMMKEESLTTAYLGGLELHLFLSRLEFMEDQEDESYVQTEFFFSEMKHKFPDLESDEMKSLTEYAQRHDDPISFDVHLIDKLSKIFSSVSTKNLEYRNGCKAYMPIDVKRAIMFEPYDCPDNCISAEVYLMPLRPN